MWEYVKSLFKKKAYSLDGVDLNQEVKLCFEKNEYSEYVIYFFNPILKQWWALPSSHAGIHARWTLLNKGSYGAYDLNKLTCDYYSIERNKNKFKTLNNIKEYLHFFELDYEKFQKRRLDEAKLPNQIYK